MVCSPGRLSRNNPTPLVFLTVPLSLSKDLTSLFLFLTLHRISFLNLLGWESGATAVFFRKLVGPFFLPFCLQSSINFRLIPYVLFFTHWTPLPYGPLRFFSFPLPLGSPMDDERLIREALTWKVSPCTDSALLFSFHFSFLPLRAFLFQALDSFLRSRYDYVHPRWPPFYERGLRLSLGHEESWLSLRCL